MLSEGREIEDGSVSVKLFSDTVVSQCGSTFSFEGPNVDSFSVSNDFCAPLLPILGPIDTLEMGATTGTPTSVLGLFSAGSQSQIGNTTVEAAKLPMIDVVDCHIFGDGAVVVFPDFSMKIDYSSRSIRSTNVTPRPNVRSSRSLLDKGIVLPRRGKVVVCNCDIALRKDQFFHTDYDSTKVIWSQ